MPGLKPIVATLTVSETLVNMNYSPYAPIHRSLIASVVLLYSISIPFELRSSGVRNGRLPFSVLTSFKAASATNCGSGAASVKIFVKAP